MIYFLISKFVLTTLHHNEKWKTLLAVDSDCVVIGKLNLISGSDLSSDFFYSVFQPKLIWKLKS